MKKLTETPIGNIQSNTFRPTEAEKLVLTNIADMIEQGRNVTQQDAINIAPEKLKELNVGEDNVESAYAQLLKIKMIELNPDQTLQLTQSGQAVVAEVKKAQDQEALTQGPETKTDTGELPVNPLGQQSTIQGQSPTPPMESFNLISYLNDLSKLND